MKFVSSFTILCFFLVCTLSYAAPFVVKGPQERVPLLELYTSEGCSSCPTADKWLSQLQTSDDLWARVVPVAFHVHYWNWLGWADRFSNERYADRQKLFQQKGLSRSTYTPGFFLNGREWRSWYGPEFEPSVGTKVGSISAAIVEKSLSVRFDSLHRYEQPLQVHVVQLGSGFSTQVKRGENKGELLQHDFVALSYQLSIAQAELSQVNNKSSVYSWSLDLAKLNPEITGGAGQRGLAIWVSSVSQPSPIQSLGFWLP